MWGLISWTMRSVPELKSRVGRLTDWTPPRRPRARSFFVGGGGLSCVLQDIEQHLFLPLPTRSQYHSLPVIRTPNISRRQISSGRRYRAKSFLLPSLLSTIALLSSEVLIYAFFFFDLLLLTFSIFKCISSDYSSAEFYSKHFFCWLGFEDMRVLPHISFVREDFLAFQKNSLFLLPSSIPRVGTAFISIFYSRTLEIKPTILSSFLLRRKQASYPKGLWRPDFSEFPQVDT